LDRLTLIYRFHHDGEARDRGAAVAPTIDLITA
jgi:hypothetical protein